MLLSRQNEAKIKQFYEMCFCLTFNDKPLSYEEFRMKDGSVSNHHKDILALTTEMLKKRISSQFMSDIFMQY